MMRSQFGLDDMEALLWGPSSLMADPMGSLRHQDEVTSIEGGASPLSSSSSSSPLLLLSPPPTPPSLLLQEEKAEADLLSFPWLSADQLGHTHHIGADDEKGEDHNILSPPHVCSYRSTVCINHSDLYFILINCVFAL